MDLRCEDYSYEDKKIPSISASASVDKDGRVHISLANLNPNKPVTVNCPVIGETFKKITGEILTANTMNAYNSFENPEVVKPASFNGFTFKDGVLTVVMPSKSVVVLELTK
jgi:alpha-N-arabinofuranosidase